MNRLLNKILFFSILLVLPAITAQAICPSSGSTVIEVCNNASGSSTLRAYFYDGDPGSSYLLFSVIDNAYVSEPLGPVTVDTSIPLPPGAVAAVEFGNVSNGEYVIRVNCFGSGSVNIGGTGISVSSGSALNAAVTIDPDCNPVSGGANADGSITLNITGGVAPYDISWPTVVTPIANTNGAPAGNHVFPNLDGGTYSVEIADANHCVFSTTINVPIATMPLAGADQTICGPTANLSANSPGAGESGLWTGPAGVIFFPNASTPNAIVSNLAVGVNTLTWTITDTNGICPGIGDQVDITSDAPATVDAGPAQMVCSGSTVLLAGVIGGSASSATWTTSGDGSFNNNTLLNAVYTPGAADVSSGTVTLTLTTNDPAGPCVAVNDNVIITVSAAVAVEAGPAQTICSNGTATLAGSFGSAATSATWSTSGDGTFDDNTSATAVYTPGPNDVTNTTVTLTYTTNDPPGPCLPASDNVIITIDPTPVVDAGAPQAVCSGSTVTLAGIIGGSAASATWTTSGDGTFNNASALNAIYTPGANDITAGNVTLTLTSNDPAGPCVAANDNVLITINATATVEAGPAQTICEGSTVTMAGSFAGGATSVLWSTSGDGTFDDNTSPTAIYTPGLADIAATTATLTLTTNDPAGPCLPATDNVVIAIDPVPTVDAGAPQTICTGGTVPLAGVIGGSAASATWTSTGDGTFDNTSSLNAIYTPGAADLAAGTVSLTLTTNDPAGPCVGAADNVVITINALATVDAGPAQTTCQGSTVTLAGVFGGSATSATWSTSGDGSFDNNTLPGAVYTPGPTDLANGTVTLTFTTNDPAGPCLPAIDDVIITLDALPTADAGAPQAICAGSTVILAGTIGGAASSASWTSSGDGTFDNAAALNAVYTPGAADIAAGLVTLSLTTNDPAGPCLPVVDNIDITIDAAATVDAGPAQTICAGGTALLAGTFGGAATTATWSTSGDGTFDDNTSSTAVYTPGPNDLANGSATLLFTTDDPAGPCLAVSDNVVITINPAPTADAGAPQTICSGSPVTLAGAIGGAASSAGWTTSGDGTFDDASALAAIYTPGSADLLAGTVTLTLTTDDPSGPCAFATDAVIITFDPGPVADAGSAQSICISGTATLAGSSVSGTATTGAWSIVNQPAGGDGLLSDITQTATPSTVTFSATVAGVYTLRLTTNDPAGACVAVSDDVLITVTPGATADAGSPQTICEGGTATLAGTFTGTTGITWTTAGDGSFDDASLPNAVYTPGAADIANGTVTLTMSTAGPCASVSDMVIITIAPPSTVDAGAPQTICSNASIVLNATFGGSATGLIWSTSGNGTFDDNTDTNATYTPGSTDIANGSVTLTASTTGSCAGTTDNVVIPINPAATVNAGSDQSVCLGANAILGAVIGGSASSITWTTSGDGTFSNSTNPTATYTPGANDLVNGTVTLTATTNNPAGPCPAASDNLVITFMVISGDQTTAGNESWIGYAYDDSGDPAAIPGKIDFNPSKYRGYIDAADIDNMSGVSTYNTTTDEFNLDLGMAAPLQGPNVCASYLDNFSLRYKMNKTFTEGVYRFTVGSDDGVRLLIDGVDVLPAAAFALHSYTTYTSLPTCLTAGVHSLEIQYFESGGYSRLSFDFEEVSRPDVVSPVQLCVNSPVPVLAASSPDAAVTGFNWYKNGTLVFSGANYTPAAAELDMSAAGATAFQVTAVYACGETQPADVTVQVLDAATLVIHDQLICESGGVVDLRDFVDEVPPGGTFTFLGHPSISGNNFDPTGLAGSIPVTVDYSNGSCNAPQGTLNITVTNTASTTVPATPLVVCEGASDIDLTTLVSAIPAGGAFTFTGNQVTGSNFDPSGLSGTQIITVDYTVGGCAAATASFDIDVTSTASIAVTNKSACQNGGLVNLLTLVTPTPSGGLFTFSGTGVSGNMFDPSGQSGVVNVNVTYDFNGCTDSDVIQVTVLAPTDPMCIGGNCATVVIIPKPEPATCTNSDGRMVMSIKPFTPAVNNTGVKITIDGISSTGLAITRTNFNDSIFNLLPVGNYNYTIEYGDPSCVKTGIFSIDQSGTVGTPVVSNIVSPKCFGTATGMLTLDVPGETGNILEWSLDAGLTDPFKPFTAGGQITGLRAGPAPTFQQVISVRRNAGDVCYSSVTVVVPESVLPINASFDITPATCNGNDGAITNIVAAGGNDAPFTYSIDGGQSFQSSVNFNGLPGGAYTVRVRDALGCEADFPANVTFPGFINTVISKTDANCTNGGRSGAITLTITDLGAFQVALSTDQFNPPADEDYLPYNNPSVIFDNLERGQYYLYVRSNTAACPTRSAPINIFGVYDITFDLQPDCQNNALSLVLVNVTGEAGGAPLEIQVSKKASSDPPEIIYQQFPADGEIYLSHNDYAFLRTPGEYRIRIIQFQFEVVCNLSSETVDFVVPAPLSAQIGSVSESYPDIPTGKLNVVGFSGGVFPYDVKIKLDSLPYHSTDFQEAGINSNQQIEMSYDHIPSGKYEVIVRDSQGCEIDLEARVPLDVDLFIPNLFTPNNDGANDVFFIRNLPQEPAQNQLVITNRWGKEVFSSDNYQNNWDGTGVADGVYFYRLQISEKNSLTGWVEIIRGPKP